MDYFNEDPKIKKLNEIMQFKQQIGVPFEVEPVQNTSTKSDIKNVAKEIGVEVPKQVEKKIEKDWSQYDKDIEEGSEQDRRVQKLAFIAEGLSGMLTAGTSVRPDSDFYSRIIASQDAGQRMAKKKDSAVKDWQRNEDQAQQQRQEQRQIEQDKRMFDKDIEESRRYDEGMGFQKDKFEWEKQQSKADKSTNDYDLKQGNDGRMYKINKKTGDVTPVSEQGGFGGFGSGVGQEMFDKTEAKMVAEFFTSGRLESLNQDIQSLEDIVNKVEKDDRGSGSRLWSTVLPEKLKGVFDEKQAIMGQKIDNVVLKTLKETFPGAISNAEREALKAAAYDPTLPPDANAANLQLKLDTLKIIRDRQVGLIKKYTGQGQASQPSLQTNLLNESSYQPVQPVQQNSGTVDMIKDGKLFKIPADKVESAKSKGYQVK